jgi:hypothetical protein
LHFRPLKQERWLQPRSPLPPVLIGPELAAEDVPFSGQALMASLSPESRKLATTTGQRIVPMSVALRPVGRGRWWRRCATAAEDIVHPAFEARLGNLDEISFV